MTVVAWDGVSEYDKVAYRKILIDGEYFLSTTPISVSHVAAAAGRDATYQFFQERTGDQPDTLLMPTDVIELRDGDTFYAVPPYMVGGVPEQGLRDEFVTITCDRCGAEHECVRAALERPRPALPKSPSLGKRQWALEQIVAVMCERGLALDILVSEIQDFLSMAGYDVPLRSYADVGAALPAEPEFKNDHWANVQASGGLPAEHAPPEPERLWALVTQWRAAAVLCRAPPAREEIALLWDRVADELKAVIGGSRPALAGSRDQLAEFAKDFFASWENPPPNSVHAVTEFIDYMRGRVSGTQEGTTP